MTNQNDPLLELIPESQLKPRQITKYKNGEIWPTYKFRRTPQSVNDFDKYTSMFSIWLGNGTRILMGPSRVYWYGDDLVALHDQHAATPWRYVSLAADDRCMLLFFHDWNCTIIGKSDENVADTATLLWDLRERCGCLEIRSYHRRFDFSVVPPEQLALLVGTCPGVPIKLDVPNISSDQSRVLVWDPRRIHLTLKLNAFTDGGDVFVNSLLERDTWFGTLTLLDKDYTENENFPLLLHAAAIDKLILPNVRPQQIRQVLAALVNEVEFKIDVGEALDLDWSSVDILPKKLTLGFHNINHSSGAHTEFICSFFRRVVQIESFVKFDFDLSFARRANMPIRIASLLVHAVVANRNLEELALHRMHDQVQPYLKDIFEMAERHDGLVCLRIARYPSETDPHYTMLKRLLNRNKKIQVTDSAGDAVTNGDEIDRFYAFNSFFRDLHRFPMKSLSLLPSVLGEALTRRPGNDFRWSAYLMANHTDALSVLMQHSSLITLEAPTLHAQELPAGADNSRPLKARKRVAASLSSQTKKVAN